MDRTFHLATRLLAMPGIVIHELAHYYFCQIAGARVHDVVFFSFGYPAGYVLHTAPRRYTSHLLITLGPLLVNSLFAILLFAATTVMAADILDTRPPRAAPGEIARLVVAAWLGLAIALQALPSTGDANSLWQVTRWHLGRRHYWVFLGYPIVWLLHLANILRLVFIDWLYAILLAWIAYLFATA